MTPTISHRRCAFKARLNSLKPPLHKIIQLIHDRSIQLEGLHLQALDETGTHYDLLISCILEKDRAYRTLLLIRNIEGVVEVEKMEGK